MGEWLSTVHRDSVLLTMTFPLLLLTTLLVQDPPPEQSRRPPTAAELVSLRGSDWWPVRTTHDRGHFGSLPREVSLVPREECAGIDLRRALRNQCIVNPNAALPRAAARLSALEYSMADRETNDSRSRTSQRNSSAVSGLARCFPGIRVTSAEHPHASFPA